MKSTGNYVSFFNWDYLMKEVSGKVRKIKMIMNDGKRIKPRKLEINFENRLDENYLHTSIYEHDFGTWGER